MKKRKIIMILFVLCWISSGMLLAQAEDSQAVLDQQREGVISFTTYGENKVEISKGSGFLFTIKE